MNAGECKRPLRLAGLDASQLRSPSADNMRLYGVGWGAERWKIPVVVTRESRANSIMIACLTLRSRSREKAHKNSHSELSAL